MCPFSGGIKNDCLLISEECSGLSFTVVLDLFPGRQTWLRLLLCGLRVSFSLSPLPSWSLGFIICVVYWPSCFIYNS